MAHGAQLELSSRSIEGHGQNDDSTMLVDRLIEVSAWMVVLGTIRLLCTLTDFTGSYVEALRFQPITTRVVGWWLTDNRLILIVCASWPLVVSVALRRTRWPDLLPAAAATFLVLSIGGLVAATLDWSHAQGRGGTIGSFHLTRRAFLHPTLSDVFLGILGAVQLGFELVAGVRVMNLISRFRGAGALASEPGKHERARQARFGRLAVYASLGFLVLMIRMPAWSTYVEILNNSTIVRDFVLRSDFDRFGGSRNLSRRRLTADEKWARGTQELVRAAAEETNEQQFQAAKESYLNIIARLDALPSGKLQDEARPTLAFALNNLAWLEVTCSDPRLLNPAEAVTLARRAIVVEPTQGNYWNTLGVAYYRSGDWNEAKNALSRSMELRNQGDGFDWFFLALVELKLDHKDRARDLYDKAVAWYHESRPNDEELYRFQAEAAHELALPKPSRPTSVSKGPIPALGAPPNIRRRPHPNVGEKSVTRSPR
jgi:tetratricopeptide (TPR) repeat protein